MHAPVPTQPVTWRFVFSIMIVGLLWCLFVPTESFGFTDRIVAVVNKEVITWTDLQQALRDETSRLRAKYQGEEFQHRYKQKQREVLNGLIDERLQLQEAKSKGLSVTQEEIDAAIRRTPLAPTQTEEEFGRTLLLKKLFEFEVRRNVVVEDEELRRYYEANSKLFRTPPQYRLTQIFLPAHSAEAQAKMLTKAKAIYSAWIPEMSLEDLAAQYAQSVSPLGWVEEKDLVPPLAQAVKELIPNTLSQPIQTKVGIHLLIIEDVKESQPYPFEKVERDIRAKLLKERGEEAYREWQKTLKQKSFIDVRL